MSNFKKLNMKRLRNEFKLDKIDLFDSLENKQWPNIFKYGIFCYHFVDLSSLINNLYKYPILTLVKK